MPAWIKTLIAALFVAAITGAASARLTVESRLTRLETQMVYVVDMLEEVREDVGNILEKE
jgi:hypothetical protein